MPDLNMHLYDGYRQTLFTAAQVDVEAPGGNGIKAMLVTGAYSPNQNTHIFRSSVTSEVSGGGYTTGGNVLTNGIVTLDSEGEVVVDFDDPAPWNQNNSGFGNARRVVVYHDTGTASTSLLIAYSEDFGVDQGNLFGNFSFSIGAAGFIVSNRTAP